MKTKRRVGAVGVLAGLLAGILTVAISAGCTGFMVGGRPGETHGDAAVGGRVENRAGEPVAGVRIRVLPAAADWAEVGVRPAVSATGGAVTDEDGRYRIAHAPDGLFRVEADLNGFYVYPVRMTTYVFPHETPVEHDFQTVPLNGRPTAIGHIQGRSHRSPLEDERVDRVVGVVTVVRDRLGGPPWSDDFRELSAVYLQDPLPDGAFRSSDAIKLVVRSSESLRSGDILEVRDAVVREILTDPPYYDREWGGGLSRTQLEVDDRTTVELLRRTAAYGRALRPPALSIGVGHFEPPRLQSFDGVAARDLWHDDSLFLPAARAVDFYESMEHMRVSLADPVVTGPTDRFGQLFVAPDRGEGFLTSGVHGGAVLGSYNTSHAIVEVLSVRESMPALPVGAVFRQNIDGALDYHRGRYAIVSDGAHRVPVDIPDTHLSEVASRNEQDIAVAAFNVHNLSAADEPERFTRLAQTLVNGLGAPDIVALIEVLDDGGAGDGAGGDPTARETIGQVLSAISAAGGPDYSSRWIDPNPDDDGGAPGGNPRPVFLFDPARVGALDAGDATAETEAVVDPEYAPNGEPGAGVLRWSPARIGIGLEAFEGSRKPLVQAFEVHGEALYIVAVHFSSKVGDTPRYGRTQPPDRRGSEQFGRHPQASAVAMFVEDILGVDPSARVLVLGDVNDFQFSQTADILLQSGLTSLIQQVEPERRYTYNFQGRSQVLDQMFVSDGLLHDFEARFDIVHRYTALPENDERIASDHEPIYLVLRSSD